MVSSASPCIRICCLDDDLTCIGCFRSLQEIKDWGVVDDRRRGIILKNAELRKVTHSLRLESGRKGFQDNGSD